MRELEMTQKIKYDPNSKVEQILLEKSGRQLIYRPTEKIGVIEVDNFPILGEIVAVRFIEWVQKNPGGVISLPTGKTPEHFIKWVQYYLRNWDIDSAKQKLESFGIDPSIKPDMKSLYFVQIDEFYPINPQQRNSFFYYVNKFYMNGFGLDRDKALLLDLSQVGIPKGMTLNQIFPHHHVDLNLRFRHAKSGLEGLQKYTLELVDQYCSEYEDKIKSMGGIGFFLGGIGPDGHIGFNVQGSDHHSTTRLTPTNYETQAAAATDLGGIDIARTHLVITIGLQTITYNSDAVVIIMAAGEAKSKIVATSVESEKAIQYPATVLHDLKHSRFYLTSGAAKHLVERRYVELVSSSEIDDERAERIVLNLSMMYKKPILELKKSDFTKNRFGTELLKKKNENFEELKQQVYQSVIRKLEQGMAEIQDETFLHTAPHHDDIMLGYLGYIIHLVRSPLNRHNFVYATSGFNAVTNSYVLNLIKKLQIYITNPDILRLIRENYFDPANKKFRDRDVSKYLDGIAERNQAKIDEGECRRLLRNLVFLYEEDNLDHLKERIDELINYFTTQYPGKKDLAYIQQLKGMIREWEADLLWAHFGSDASQVKHLRLGFYKGDIFTEEPEIGRDVMPFLRLMEIVRPTTVTVALDPEGSGPDTHYKVLQIISEALKTYQKNTNISNINVIGYRNVWFRFHPSEATLFVPVSLSSLSILDSAFMNYFRSQSEASFPSYELDGPFCRLAQKIMVEQYENLKVFLGDDYFNNHRHPRIRAAHGLVFLKKMTLDQFYQRSMELRKSIEHTE
jgi:glucosamine-6-phosphate deaminase